jgi:hypothetical protein
VNVQNRRRLVLSAVFGLSVLTPALASPGDPQPDAPTPPKPLRGVILRLDAAKMEGGGGFVVAIDELAESGKTAKFEDATGARIAAGFEIAPGFWLDGSLAFYDPELKITTHRGKGEGDIVQRASVRAMPVLIGFEFRPRRWREGSVLWGIGLHYAWVRYGSLPFDLGVELQSTESRLGFDARLDFRLGKKPWMLGVELEFLPLEPELTDSSTGETARSRTDAAHWSVGVSRVF